MLLSPWASQKTFIASLRSVFPVGCASHVGIWLAPWSLLKDIVGSISKQRDVSRSRSIRSAVKHNLLSQFRYHHSHCSTAYTRHRRSKISEIPPSIYIPSPCPSLETFHPIILLPQIPCLLLPRLLLFRVQRLYFASLFPPFQHPMHLIRHATMYSIAYH